MSITVRTIPIITRITGRTGITTPTASIRMGTIRTDIIRTIIRTTIITNGIVRGGITIIIMPAGYRTLGPANGTSTKERPGGNKGRFA